MDGGQAIALQHLFEAWPQARFNGERRDTGLVVEQIFSSASTGSARPFHLLLKGTNFQINVWKALLAIPAGHLVSYRDLATTLGRPQAFRAVAGAVAANALAYLIPCHRVILGTGRIQQYRWGSTRKKAIIGWEAAVRQRQAEVEPWTGPQAASDPVQTRKRLDSNGCFG